MRNVLLSSDVNAQIYYIESIALPVFGYFRGPAILLSWLILNSSWINTLISLSKIPLTIPFSFCTPSKPKTSQYILSGFSIYVRILFEHVTEVFWVYNTATIDVIFSKSAKRNRFSLELTLVDANNFLDQAVLNLRQYILIRLETSNSTWSLHIVQNSGPFYSHLSTIAFLSYSKCDHPYEL